MSKKTSTIAFLLVLLVALFVFFKILPSNNAVAPETETDFELLPQAEPTDETDTDQTDEGAYISPVETSPATLEPEAETPDPIIPGGATDAAPQAEPGYISQDEEINILLDEPQPGAVLASPFRVSGKARASGNALIVRVTNPEGKVMIEETVQAHSGQTGDFGPFKITLSYQFSSTKTGFVEVFSQNPLSGGQDNLVKLPVRFE